MTAMPYDFMIRVDGREGVPINGKFVAADDARAALVERFNLASLEAYSVQYTLKSSTTGWKLKGHITAQCAQPCVVTLEPVAETVETDFEVRFVPADSPELAESADEDVFADPDAEDLDAIVNGSVPVGETAAQYFALALDPFPRSPAADALVNAKDSPVISEDVDEASRNPFAKLAVLKTGGDDL